MYVHFPHCLTNISIIINPVNNLLKHSSIDEYLGHFYVFFLDNEHLFIFIGHFTFLTLQVAIPSLWGKKLSIFSSLIPVFLAMATTVHVSSDFCFIPCELPIWSLCHFFSAKLLVLLLNFEIYSCLRVSKCSQFSECKHNLMPQSKWNSCPSQSRGWHIALRLCFTDRKLPDDKLAILSSERHMSPLSSSK